MRVRVHVCVCAFTEQQFLEYKLRKTRQLMEGQVIDSGERGCIHSTYSTTVLSLKHPLLDIPGYYHCSFSSVLLLILLDRVGSPERSEHGYVNTLLIDTLIGNEKNRQVDCEQAVTRVLAAMDF